MKQIKKQFPKTIVVLLQLCFLLVAPVQRPLHAVPSNFVDRSERETLTAQSNIDEALLKLSEHDLQDTVRAVYEQAKVQSIEHNLPEPFLLCYALLCDNKEQVTKDDCALALQVVIDWSSDQLWKRGEHRSYGVGEDRTPRPENANKPVGPGNCCNLEEVLRLLALINTKLGSGIDVDLSSIEQCCNNLTTEVIQDFNETWTILAQLITPTIVISIDLSPVFTVLTPIQQCCTN